MTRVDWHRELDNRYYNLLKWDLGIESLIVLHAIHQSINPKLFNSHFEKHFSNVEIFENFDEVYEGFIRSLKENPYNCSVISNMAFCIFYKKMRLFKTVLQEFLWDYRE